MIKTFENCSPEYQITIVWFFIFLTLLCMILVIYEGTGKRQRKMLLLDKCIAYSYFPYNSCLVCVATGVLRRRFHDII